jgi:hypothetical protein
VPIPPRALVPPRPDRRKRRIDVRRSTSCSSAERSASIGTVVWMYLSALAVLTGA